MSEELVKRTELCLGGAMSRCEERVQRTKPVVKPIVRTGADLAAYVDPLMKLRMRSQRNG